ncbi:cyclopropane-fatty-acyl-phospholipid synthase family protein [Rhodobacter sp. CZR27]|uniref:SAM-dependent methyltransferase n=1 Tax=Rhodobacter sp. CZR27 TaxID=2033869 RepID=UPI000BBEF998|nr:class I SAM-dependent methyltransferase [Rhodobacter sp. CZR27]
MTDSRGLSADEARRLRPGDEHYRAYVGPPGQWDYMGATQFRLLTTLGLREGHRLLDVGCGGLRAGRLLMMYLARGHYYGIEPNMWLVEDAIERELGPQFVALKAPVFSDSAEFAADAFAVKFDFIVAQSIFSHTGSDLLSRALERFRTALAPDGLILATFLHSEDRPDLPVEAPGWTYPGCTSFSRPRIAELVSAAGLVSRPLPWFHPRQSWHALAHRVEALPPADQDHHLTGAVLRDAEFAASRKELR